MTHTRAVAKRARKASLPRDLEGGVGVGILMGRLHSRLLLRFDAEAASLGLTGAQSVVLLKIADKSAETAADLCRDLHYDTGSMTRILDGLEKRGAIRRERSEADRRVVHLRLTPAGRSLHPKLKAIGSRIIDEHLLGFSENEVELLKRFLNRMIDNGG